MALQRKRWVDHYEKRPVSPSGAGDADVPAMKQPSASPTQPRKMPDFPTAEQIWAEATGWDIGSGSHGEHISNNPSDASNQGTQNNYGFQQETPTKNGLMRSRWAPKARAELDVQLANKRQHVSPEKQMESQTPPSIANKPAYTRQSNDSNGAIGIQPANHDQFRGPKMDIAGPEMNKRHHDSDGWAAAVELALKEENITPKSVSTQDNSRDPINDGVAQRLTAYAIGAATGSRPVAQEIDWNAVREPRKKGCTAELSDDSSLISKRNIEMPCAFTHYIKNWLQSTHQVVATFLSAGIEDHEDCDVDTETGLLISPVIYPGTKRCANPLLPQLNDSSQLHINRALLKVAAKQRRSESFKPKTVEPKKLKPPEPVSLPHDVRIPSHLRPAVRDDMNQVMEIFNNEVATGYGLPDMEPSALPEFLRLFDHCMTEKLVFIVAVEGWHNPNNTAEDKVIGFAVVNVLTRSFLGSYATRSNPCGKLMVVVHHDYRRKNIGGAMFDAVFACSSGGYAPRMGYQFVHGEPPDPKYLRPDTTFPDKAIRLWQSIDVEFIIQTDVTKDLVRAGEEYKWIRKLFEREFCMVLVGHDFQFYKNADKTQRAKWYDRLTFRHYCEGYHIAVGDNDHQNV
ncbi:hypothetical protein F5B20DRAFT_592022 [Whalleya microplaca]|nr:hypothetical protein F5B20DRAFT_592022 [Whalleya microplaca]